jgi:hypothetical protein
MAVTVYFGTNRNAIAGPVPNNFGTDFSTAMAPVYYRLVPEVRNDICGAMMGLDGGVMPNRIYRKKGNYWRLDLAK